MLFITLTSFPSFSTPSLRHPTCSNNSPRPQPPRPPPSLPLKALQNALSQRDTCQIPILLPPLLPALPLSQWHQAVTACYIARDFSSGIAAVKLGIPVYTDHISLPIFIPLLRAATRAASWTHVMDLLQLMWDSGPSSAPDERLIVSLANTAVDKRVYPFAYHLFQLMESRGLVKGPYSYSVLLKSHGRQKNILAVRSIMQDLATQQIPLDNILFNTAIDAYIRCDDIRAAALLLRNPQNASLLDTASFNTLIKGFSQRGHIHDAFAVAEDMRAAGCLSNHVTTNTLLTACVKARDFDRAFQLADSLASSIPPQSTNDPSSSPSHDTKQLTIAFTAILAGLADVGRLQQAMRLLNNMSRRNIPPSDITYAALLSACFKQRAANDAVQLFESIPYPNAQNDWKQLRSLHVCNTYIAGLARLSSSPHVEIAVQLVTTMVREAKRRTGRYVYPNVTTYNALIDAFVRMGLFHRAEVYLNLMQRQGCRPNVVSFTIMMNGYGNARMYQKAKVMFREISRRDLQPDRVALNAFISVCTRSKDIDSALKVLSYMENFKGALSPAVYSYTPLMKAFVRSGKNEEAWDIYKRMRLNGIPLNSYCVVGVTNHVIAIARDVASGNMRYSTLHQAAVHGAEMLQDAQEDGVDMKLLQKCRRNMLAVMLDAKSRRHFDRLSTPELKSASETIFEKHGWNNIDSGWRVL